MPPWGSQQLVRSAADGRRNPKPCRPVKPKDGRGDEPSTMLLLRYMENERGLSPARFHPADARTSGKSEFPTGQNHDQDTQEPLDQLLATAMPWFIYLDESNGKYIPRTAAYLFPVMPTNLQGRHGDSTCHALPPRTSGCWRCNAIAAPSPHQHGR